MPRSVFVSSSCCGSDCDSRVGSTVTFLSGAGASLTLELPVPAAHEAPLQALNRCHIQPVIIFYLTPQSLKLLPIQTHNAAFYRSHILRRHHGVVGGDATGAIRKLI